MHIGLNAHLLSFGSTYRGAGISRYIRNLIDHMAIAQSGDRFTVFLGDHNPPEEWKTSDALHLAVSRLPTVRPAVRIVWEQLIQPFEVARQGVDVLHSMGYVKPIASPTPSVVTVYDLSFVTHPEAFNRSNQMYLQSMTRRSVASADHIIAISESTKGDLVNLFHVPPERVSVIYPGVEECFKPVERQTAIEQLRKNHQVPDQFILFFGTLEPRKGADKLLEAYAALKKAGCSQHLVIGGAKGWLYDHIFTQVGELGLQDVVHFVGYVHQDEQPLWYNCADLFVYPSLYEGFGFPPLEAMACGTPVITTDVSSLPEVVGDAAVLVKPGDSESLREAMSYVLASDERRMVMSKRGLDRVGNFSWTDAARSTLDVYHLVGDRR